MATVFNNRLCWTNGRDGVEKIELRQGSNRMFMLVYGYSVKGNLSYWLATRELGAAIMHLAACENKLDNTGE